MAGRLRLPRLRPRRGLAAGRWAVRVRRLPGAHLDDGGHDLRPDAHAADGVVHPLLAVRLRQGRYLRAESATDVGDRLVPDRVGDAASTAFSTGAAGRDRLSGTVEVDETYIGGEEPGLRGGRARGKKVLTGIAVEVREPKGIGRCRMAPLTDASADSAHAFVTDHVEPGSTVITDAWQGYRGLDTLGYVHDRRSQRAARARGEDPGALLPAVHRVAALIKRWLLGTHQGSAEATHLSSYMNEFVFRFNRRRSRSRDHRPVDIHRAWSVPQRTGRGGPPDLHSSGHMDSPDLGCDPPRQTLHSASSSGKVAYREQGLVWRRPWARLHPVGVLGVRGRTGGRCGRS